MKLIRDDARGVIDVLGVPLQPPTLSKSGKSVTIAATGYRPAVDTEGDAYFVSVSVTRPTSEFDAADLKAAQKRRKAKDARQGTA